MRYILGSFKKEEIAIHNKQNINKRKMSWRHLLNIYKTIVIKKVFVIIEINNIKLNLNNQLIYSYLKNKNFVSAFYFYDLEPPQMTKKHLLNHKNQDFLYVYASSMTVRAPLGVIDLR